jgi:hypothetical protein
MTVEDLDRLRAGLRLADDELTEWHASPIDTNPRSQGAYKASFSERHLATPPCSPRAAPPLLPPFLVFLLLRFLCR